MSASYTGIPIIGQDSAGNNIMVVTNSDGNSVATSNTNAIAVSNNNPVTPPAPGVAPSASSSWSNVEITSLFKNAAGNIIGLGIGVDQSGATNNLVWIRTSDGWKVGISGLQNQVRPMGLEYTSTWLIADGSKVYSSDFNLTTATPAGGFSTSTPSITTIAEIPVDSLNNSGTNDLKPQTEEGISEVKFADLDWFKSPDFQTYSSIRDIIAKVL